MNRSAVILQVEDDDNDVLLLQYAFRTARISNPLQSVPNVPRAIDYLNGRGEFSDRTLFPFPCLVLSDIKLPGETGLELLQWIRAQAALRGLVVIMLTSSASPAEIDLAYELGANSFIIKPAGADKLVELVKSLHGYWIEQNRFSSTLTSPGSQHGAPGSPG